MKSWKLIQKGPGVNYYVTVGARSRDFYRAYQYSDGFAVVKVYEKDKYFRYRDDKGNLSEFFKFASSYKEGFAQVVPQDENSLKFRDMLGRITQNKTKSGEDFYKLYKGTISVQDLDSTYFNDPIFVEGIIEFLKDNSSNLSEDELKILKTLQANMKVVNNMIPFKNKIAHLLNSINKINPNDLANEEYFHSIVQKLIDRFSNIAADQSEEIQKRLFSILQKEIIKLNEKLYAVLKHRYAQILQTNNPKAIEFVKKELEDLEMLLGKSKQTPTDMETQETTTNPDEIMF